MKVRPDLLFASPLPPLSAIIRRLPPGQHSLYVCSASGDTVPSSLDGSALDDKYAPPLARDSCCQSRHCVSHPSPSHEDTPARLAASAPHAHPLPRSDQVWDSCAPNELVPPPRHITLCVQVGAHAARGGGLVCQRVGSLFSLRRPFKQLADVRATRKAHVQSQQRRHAAETALWSTTVWCIGRYASGLGATLFSGWGQAFTRSVSVFTSRPPATRRPRGALSTSQPTLGNAAVHPGAMAHRAGAQYRGHQLLGASGETKAYKAGASGGDEDRGSVTCFEGGLLRPQRAEN